MVTLAFVPTLVGALVGYALLGRDLMLGLRPPDFSDAGVIVSYVLVMVISLAIYGVTVALLVQLAYDVKIGRRGAIAGYIGQCRRSGCRRPRRRPPCPSRRTRGPRARPERLW